MTTIHTFTPAVKTTHSGSARLERTVTYLAGLYAKWQAHRAAVLADEEMWAFAHSDPRLMAEIQAALASGK